MKNLNPQQVNKKVLVISYTFPPIAFAGTYRSLRFCRYLPETNWIPEVLTIKEGNDLHLDYDLLDRIPRTVNVHRTHTFDPWRLWNSRCKNQKSGAMVYKATNKKKQIKSNGRDKGVRQLARYFNKLLWELVTIPDHMIFWVVFAVIRGYRILKREPIDIIYTSSPPHSEHITGLLLSRLFQKPWVADFRDPILDSSGYNPPTHLRFKVDQWLEKLVVRNANKILIISDYYHRIIAKRYPLFKNKFITLPNGYDPAIFENSRTIKYDKFTIIYSGSFYARRKPDFFLKGFEKWLSTKSKRIRNNVQAIFYSPPPSGAVRKIIEENKLKEFVHFPGMISQDELIPKLKGAHLLLLIIGFDTESRGTVTSKIFEYMACQRPILAIIPEGDASDILKDYPLTYFVQRNDEAILIEQLEKAYNQYVQQIKNQLDIIIPKINFTTANPYDARLQTKQLSSIFFEALNYHVT